MPAKDVASKAVSLVVWHPRPLFLHPIVFGALGFYIARSLLEYRQLLGLAVGGVIAALVAVFAWQRPLQALVAVAVGISFQELGQAWLFKHGIADVSTLTMAGYWKEMIVVIVVIRAIQQRPRGPFDNLELAALVYVGIVLVYVVLPFGPDLRVRYIAARADAGFVVLFLAARWLRSKDSDRNRAEVVFLAGAAIVAAFGLWNYMNPEGWTDWIHGTGLTVWRRSVLLSASYEPVLKTEFGGSYVTRVGSLFLDPTGLAYFLIFPVAIAASRRVRKVSGRLDIVAGALCGMCILVTFTRSAIALLLVVGVVVASGSGKLGRGVAMLVVGAAVIIGVSATVGAGGQVASGFDSKDPRTEAHITALKDSTERAILHPFGTGLGTVATVANRFGVEDRLETSEDFYLQIANEVGLVPTAAFIAMVIILWRTLWRDTRRDPDQRPLAAAGGLAAMALGAVVLHTFANMPATWGLFVLIGLSLPKQRAPESDRFEPALGPGMVADRRR